MDKALSGPLGLIAEKQLIKDHGVEKTYHLRNEPLETDQRRIMYLVRATMENMKVACNFLFRDSLKSPDWIDDTTAACQFGANDGAILALFSLKERLLSSSELCGEIESLYSFPSAEFFRMCDITLNWVCHHDFFRQ
jgi:hypothetical protein